MIFYILWAIFIISAVAFFLGVNDGVKERRAKRDAIRAASNRNRLDIIDFLKLREKLALPCVPVTLTDEVSIQLTESRMGGRPAWPVGKEHPKPKGKFPFCFLAQINLDDMPKLDGYPGHGLLQFFFAADDLFGMRFPDGKSDGSSVNSDILVVHHDTSNDMEEWVMFTSEDDIIELEVPFSVDFPNWWQQGYKLSFGDIRPMHPTFDDYRIYDDYSALEGCFSSEALFFEYSDRWGKDEPTGIVIGGIHILHKWIRAIMKRDYANIPNL